MRKKPEIKITVPRHLRPTCIDDGCSNVAHNTGNYLANGMPVFRKYCAKHHLERGKIFNELKASLDISLHPECGAVGCCEKVELTGTDENNHPIFNTYCNEHVNLSTAYLGYRKDYCENIDGRLGFKCTTNVYWPGMLDVDHINGTSTDNREENLQTLCKCCHAYKGWVNKDYATPGRKTLKKS